MKKIVFTCKAEEKSGIGSKIYSYLAILLGFYAVNILMTKFQVKQISDITPVLLALSAFAAIYLAILFFLYFRHRRLFIWLMVITGLISVIFFLRTDFIWKGIFHGFAAIFSGGSNPEFPIIKFNDEAFAAVSFAFQWIIEIRIEHLVIYSVIVCTILFAAEVVFKLHFFVYLLTSALLLLTPFAGIEYEYVNIALLLVFQIFFYAFSASGRKLGAAFEGASKSGAAAALLALIAVIAAIPISGYIKDIAFGAVDRADEQVFRIIKDFEGGDRLEKATGVISGRNNYVTDTVKISAYSNNEITYPIYLIGFRGGEYTEKGFDKSRDGAYFSGRVYDYRDPLGSVYMNLFALDIDQRITEEEFGKLSFPQPVSLYEKLYGREEETLDARSLHLRYDAFAEKDNELTHYFPYYSQYNEEMGYALQGEDAEYSYTCFNPKECYISDFSSFGSNIMTTYDADYELITSFEKAPPSPLMKRTKEELLLYKKRAMQDFAGGDFIRGIGRLRKLVEANPLEDLEEITAFIMETLSGCTYTRTPGMRPLNKDPVEYFLFESRTGYCQQFAAAATLMYRLYGIPARYVSGYRIDRDLWEPDGPPQKVQSPTYIGEGAPLIEVQPVKAELTDVNAHSWVEIFSVERGWYPVDVTPAADGTMAEPSSYFPLERIKEIIEEQSWNGSLELDRFANSGEDEASTGEWHGSGLAIGSIIRGIGKERAKAPLIAVLLSIPLIAFCIISGRREFIKRMRPRQAFRLIIKEADCKLSGYEQDFAEKLSEQITPIDIEEAERLKKIVLAEAFGSVKCSDDDAEFCRSLYRKIKYGKNKILPKA